MNAGCAGYMVIWFTVYWLILQPVCYNYVINNKETGIMKRTAVLTCLVLFIAPAAFAEVLSVDPAATPKPIRITVEGLEDARVSATASPATITATTQPGINILKRVFRHPVDGIKKMIKDNSMESEVIDAIIAKLADMEEDQKRQQALNAFMLAGMIVLLAALAAVLLIKRKKKKG